MTLVVGSGRPSGGYGKGYISASGLASRYGAAEPLLRWGYGLAREGRNPFVERDLAAAVGSAVHSALLAWMQGDMLASWQLDECERPDEAHAAYEAGVRWVERQRADGWREESAEVPLVSESMRLAGTYDLTMTRGDERKLVDWKSKSPLTSSGKTRTTMLSESTIIQMGAYWMLLDQAGMRCDCASIVYLPRAFGFEASEVPVDVVLARRVASKMLHIAQTLDAERARLRDWARPVAVSEPLDVPDIDELSFDIEETDT